VYYILIEMAIDASVNGNLVHQREQVGLLGVGSASADTGSRSDSVLADNTTAGDDESNS
jgi:hypothetical protein